MNISSAEARSRGQEAEAAAAQKLEQMGCRIIARNYRAGNFGELDIVAQKAEKIIFCEIKARSNCEQWGGTEAAITAKKLGKMKKAALCFIRENLLMNYDTVFLAGLVQLDETGKIVSIRFLPLEML